CGCAEQETPPSMTAPLPDSGQTPAHSRNVVGGELLPWHFVAHTLRERFDRRLGEDSCRPAAKRFTRWWHRCDAAAGPATALRTLVEGFAVPMFAILGFHLADVVIDDRRKRVVARAEAFDLVSIPVVCASWSEDLDRCWRDAVREGVTAG